MSEEHAGHCRDRPHEDKHADHLGGCAAADLFQLRMVHVPQCNLCAADGPPFPRHVDFNNDRMTFIVHKSLKEAAAFKSS